MISIYDVAKAAGTSIATVSYVLNNSNRVSKATAERVRRAIEELNYQPKASAQALARGRTLTITLIAPISIYAHQASLYNLIQGIGQALESTDYRLYIHPTLHSPGASLEVEAAIRSHQMDGVILMHIEREDPRIELLRQSKIPFVLIGRCEHDEDLSLVDADVEAVIDTAVSHLKGLGRTRIGLFGEGGEANITRRLVQGFENSIRSHGLVYEERYCAEFSEDPEEIDRAISEVLSQPDRPSAIFAVSDLAVMGVYKAANALGLRIPQDLAVIGYADSPLYPYLTPSCSAVFAGATELGCKAAETLLAKLTDDAEFSAQLLVPPRLIIRDSTVAKS
ncbi:transcriptional regulator [Longilinea arvoryzae]|uniref:Transcriptional regulator n=1 Tax=Longilinea arvoryzae TaxID=360412 RepID=A0A0S7BIC9_9CHLR|nr:LacI family DNA-binding transcriptional regulator [Longilinea arvoryzae]GAP13633.1 transcriptional regulator [Longilinea arvoryzae]